MTNEGGYIYLEWYDTPDFELVRGHVDPVEALELVVSGAQYYDRYYDEEARWFVYHTYARWIPCTHWEPDFDITLKINVEKKRGAFPVTIVESLDEMSY